MTIDRSDRVEWLDAAKGLLIFFVVYFHAEQYMGFYKLASPVAEFFVFVFRPICIPLFVMLAGVTAARVLERDFSALVVRRLLPLAYVLTVWAILRFVYFDLVEYNVLSPRDGTRWIEIVRVWISPTNELWFLWALVLYLPAAWVFGRFNRPLVLCAALVVFVATTGKLIPIGGMGRYLTVAVFPFFLLGCWYGRATIDLLARHAGPAGIAAFVVYWPLLAVHFVYADALPGLAMGIIKLLLCGLGMTWFILVLRWASRFRFARPLVVMGRSSLAIYVMHVMLIVPLSQAASVYGGSLPGFAHYSVVLISLVAISLVLAIVDLSERFRFGRFLGIARRSERHPVDAVSRFAAPGGIQPFHASTPARHTITRDTAHPV